jgi:hypothetical protein
MGMPVMRHGYVQVDCVDTSAAYGRRDEDVPEESVHFQRMDVQPLYT